MAMTAEQLEELLGKVTQGDWVHKGYLSEPWIRRGYDMIVNDVFCGPSQIVSNCTQSDATLIALAPSLARRVIAAEKLVEAASNAAMYLESGFINCGKCGDEVETKHTDAEYELRSALTAYRKARGL